MFDAIVVAHYNFENKNGKEINTSKLRVSLDKYGYLEICSDKVNDLPVLSQVKVELNYDEKYNKITILKVTK